MRDAVAGREYPFERETDIGGLIDSAAEAVSCKIFGIYALIGDGVRVTGTIVFTLPAACALCNTPLTKAFSIGFDEIFAENGGDGYAYNGDKLDLEPLMRDEVLFAVPARLLCREGCKGLCYVCGADLNDGECGCPRGADSGTARPFESLKDELEK